MEFGNTVGEYVHAGALITRYVHSDRLVARQNSPGTGAFYSFDALGSATELIGAAGVTTNFYAYLPFGELLYQSEAVGNAFKFIGELGVRDDGKKLLSMRSRDYSTAIGRFTSFDEWGLAGGDINMARYVRNDPIRNIDPDGHYSLVERFGWGECCGASRDCANYSPEQISRLSPTQQACQRHDKRLHDSGKNWWDTGDPQVSNIHCKLVISWLGLPEEVCDSDDPQNPLRFPPPPDPRRHPECASDGPCSGDPESLACFCCLNPEAAECGGGGGGGSTQPAAPSDPNLLIGPQGFGTSHFIRRDVLLPYTIHFENETNASAPAQQVFIIDSLTNKLDWQTFELTEIAFGDVFIAVPPGTKHFEKTTKMKLNGVDFDVQIEAGIRLATGEVYATFRSIIPTTGLPPAVDTGFLPPENGTGRGMGHIGYTIRAHTNLVTGTEIRNVATIQFDYQPSLRTDLVDPHNPGAGIDTNKQALVTIDGDLPTSSVTSLSPTATNATFTVCWSGSDIGSGIASYDIYVSTNVSGTNGSWTLWLAGATANCASFQGENNKTYSFYSVAHDGSGNIEPAPVSADTSITTYPNYAPVLLPLTNQITFVGKTFFVTNRAVDFDLPAQTLTFSLAPGAPSGATINPTNGLFRWQPTREYGSTTNNIRVIVTDNGSPSL